MDGIKGILNYPKLEWLGATKHIDTCLDRVRRAQDKKTVAINMGKVFLGSLGAVVEKTLYAAARVLAALGTLANAISTFDRKALYAANEHSVKGHLIGAGEGLVHVGQAVACVVASPFLAIGYTVKVAKDQRAAPAAALREEAVTGGGGGIGAASPDSGSAGTSFHRAFLAGRH